MDPRPAAGKTDGVLRWRGGPWWLVIGLILLGKGGLKAGTETGSIAGQVVSENGSPVAGAKVFLYAYTGGLKGDRIEGRTISGGDGTFSFSPGTPPGKPPETCVIIAVKEGRAVGWQRLSETPDLHRIRLLLGEGRDLSGRVQDEAGNPLAGVSVRINSLVLTDPQGVARGYLFLGPSLNLLATQTDSQGEFTLSGLPQGVNARMEVVHPDYAREVRNVRPEVRSDLSIHLSPGGQITGRVTVAATGNPVAGLLVSCQGRFPTQGSGGDLTDAQGRFHITSLEEGTYDVQVQFGEEGVEWTPAGQTGVTVRAGEVTPGVDLQLVPGEVLTGRVRDAQTGTPLAGVGVGALYMETGLSQSTVTDGEGIFRLRLAPGKVQVNLWSPPEGYVRDPLTSFQLVQIVAGEEPPEVQFEVQPGVSVVGQVIDPEGQPVAGADVWEGRLDSGTRRAQSDSQGRFTLPDLLGGRTVTLQARHEARELAGSLQVHPQAGSLKVILKLEKIPPIRGRIVNDEGQPLPHATVTVFVAQGGDKPDFFVPFTPPVEVDLEGHYEITQLIPGTRFFLQAQAEGYGQSNTETLTAVGGEEKDLGDLVLPRADSFLAGRVTDADGQPLAGVEVQVYGGVTHKTVTDDQGRFYLDSLVRGEVYVNLRHPDYKPDYQSNVPTGGEELNFVLVDESPPGSQNIPLGAPAPELNVAWWLHGPIGNLAQLRGRVVLLAFCPAYSPAARNLLPQLQRLHTRYKKEGLTVLQVVDDSARLKEVRRFARQMGLTYPIGGVRPAPCLGWYGSTFRSFGIVAVPTVFLIDKRGVLRYVDVEERLEEKVAVLLAE